MYFYQQTQLEFVSLSWRTKFKYFECSLICYNFYNFYVLSKIIEKIDQQITNITQTLTKKFTALCSV